MRTVKWLIFGLGALCALAAPLWQIGRAEWVMRTGSEWRFSAAPVDPYDPFRGRYLTLSLAPNSYRAQTPEEKALLKRVQRGDRLFFALKKDEKGMAQFASVSDKAPAEGDYLRLEVAYSYGEEVRLASLFERCFVNEDIAPAVDEAMRERRADSVAVLRVLDGDAVLEAVEIDGVPIDEFVQRSANKAR